MCIAILNKKDSILNDSVLINSYRNNPHGCGIAYVNKNNELIVDKGLWKEEEFIQKYKTHKQKTISDMLIHCRIATAGEIDTINTHPHIINNNLVLIHNGILNINVPKNSKKSDTIIFIEKYLKNLTIEQLQDPLYIRLLADFIGANNKFVIIDKNKQTYIINEASGHYDKELNWYSNSSYQNDILILEKPNFLTRQETKDIAKIIKNLTPNDFYTMGNYPVLDLYNFELSNKVPDYVNTFPLEEIDYKLFDMYLNRYQILTEDYKSYAY